MPTKFRKHFDIGLADLEMIENALRHQARHLSLEKLGQLENGEQVPADNPDQIDSQIVAIEAVLGKLHNQKAWYTPEEYVPRG